MKAALAALSSLLLLPVLVIAAALGSVGQSGPSVAALADIPPDYLNLYQQAGIEFAIPWQLLAAVGRVESDHGRNPNSWTPNAAGAVGPMQFEPETFAEYSWATGSAHPNIDDPHDAIFTAAAMLVANNGRSDPRAALYAYNHAYWYVDEVLNWVAIYTSESTGSTGGLADIPVADAGPAAGAALSYALAQLGTPYVWAAEQPGVAFDCSGLVQAAYAAAGIQLPRVAQDQYDAGPPVPSNQPLEPGDLVFFGADQYHVEHVGIAINTNEMIDAPHTGAVVRIESVHWSNYVGATRPAAGST